MRRPYHKELEKAFFGTTWTQKARESVRQLAGDFNTLVEKLNLNTAANDIGAHKLVDAVELAVARKAVYERAQSDWEQNPIGAGGILDGAKEKAAKEAFDDYQKKLNDAFKLANGFAKHKDELAKQVDAKLSAAVAELKKVQDAATKADDFAAHAVEMEKTRVAEAAKLQQKFEALQTAAGQLIKAGGEIKVRTQEQRATGNVQIVDAAYGETRLMKRIYDAWEAAGGKSENLVEFVHHDTHDKNKQPRICSHSCLLSSGAIVCNMSTTKELSHDARDAGRSVA